MSQYGKINKNDCELEFTLNSLHVAHTLIDRKEEEWPLIYKKLTSKLTFDMKLFKRHTWNIMKEIKNGIN